VTASSKLEQVLTSRWFDVLERIDDAVLVLDRERVLRFVNPPARRLLGYEENQPIGGRCRLTTRGVDCGDACPLTFALEAELERVDDFSTIYRSSDDRPVPLKVTVIPLHDDDGGFCGAVEILRPAEPDPGFFLAGSSPTTTALKERLRRFAGRPQHLVLVGERPACRDVGRAVHRFAGLPEELFEVWKGSWDTVAVWPPGTMYADGASAASLAVSTAPDGWRLIVGVDSGQPVDGGLPMTEVVELPPVTELGDDLGLLIVGWVDRLAPGMALTADAVEHLGRLACDGGLAALERALVGAVAAADGRIEVEHIPVDGSSSPLIDELLLDDDPFAALERRLLTEVLRRSGWRMQEAADRLGVSRVTLWRKLKDHGIERPECNDS
jgi:transcriptional regulator with PAS, ATPase and Fis domain